ncbi:MAG: hypothetical protein KDB07_13875, partial [Planctomycetes bacterium]|nr:hypothetical protein [Planctomycetota bacterium]
MRTVKTSTSRPLVPAWLEWVLPCLVMACASVLSAQKINEAYELRLATASQKAPAGAWGVERNDQEARIANIVEFLQAGIVEVRGTHLPSKEFNAEKLRRAGVYMREGELELGAEWDYHQPIQNALEKVKFLLPSNSANPSTWDWSDQVVYELGRAAVPYIEARQLIEARIATLCEWIVVEAFVTRALFSPPSDLPIIQPASADRTVLERLKPLLEIPEARALLELGASQVMYEVITKIRDDNFDAHDPADKKYRDWAECLMQGLEIHEAAINDAIYGRAASEGNPAVIGLQAGLPINLQNSDRWPSADQTLLRVGGLGAIPALQAVRATNRAFANN